MLFRLSILLVGRSKRQTADVEGLLHGQSGIRVSTRVISNGHADPLYGVDELPDTLIYVASDQWRAELESLMARPPSARPPIIVVGPEDAADMMRASMRAGARDFLTLPLSRGEIGQTLTQLSEERALEQKDRSSSMTAIIDGKGGSGATTLAANLACAMAAARNCRTLLCDFDLQFGSLPSYFNLPQSNGLVKALELAEGLDAVALQAYVQRTDAGPHLLSSESAPLVLPEDVAGWRLENLLGVLGGSYDEIILDVPRIVDNISATMLEHSDRILIVMQQTIAHIRDTKRLMDILRDDVGLPEERFLVLVNRYDKKNAVGLTDIHTAFGGTTIFALPNDYARVLDSVNAGIPLVQLDQSAPLSRRLLELTDGLNAPELELDERPSRWRIFHRKRK